jgi:hypothetical protein
MSYFRLFGLMIQEPVILWGEEDYSAFGLMIQVTPPVILWGEEDYSAFGLMIQVTPPVILWGEEDSNLRRLCQQIYSLPHLTALESPQNLFNFRADGGIRTPDQLITNQLLWPTELHRQVFYRLLLTHLLIVLQQKCRPR